MCRKVVGNAGELIVIKAILSVITFKMIPRSPSLEMWAAQAYVHTWNSKETNLCQSGGW